MHHSLLKLLGAKRREEIRAGKLWDITSLWGFDILTLQKDVAQPPPFVKPDPMAVDKMRVHIILPENNSTNLTKDPNLV